MRKSRLLVIDAKTWLEKCIFKYPFRYRPFHVTPRSTLRDIVIFLDDGNVEGLLSEAIELESKFVNQNPVEVAFNLAVAYNELGMCFRLRNRFEEAEKCYRQGLNRLFECISPKRDEDVKESFVRAYHDLAEVLYFQKKFCEAKDNLEARSRLFHKIWDREMIKRNRSLIDYIERCQSCPILSAETVDDIPMNFSVFCTWYSSKPIVLDVENKYDAEALWKHCALKT